MNKIVLSIIIPVYNVENYIIKTLESIFKNDLTNLEIIIINDGSSDQTKNVIENYLEHVTYGNIKLHSQCNMGVSIARNTGISLAVGEYVYFLDGDDLVSEDFVSKTVNILVSNDKYDMLVFMYGKVDDNGKFINNSISKIATESDLLVGKEIISRTLSGHIIDIWTASAIYNRQVLVDNNIYFFPGCRYGEDIEFIYKALLHMHKIRVLAETLSYYRIRNVSAINSLNYNQVDGIYARLRIINLLKTDNYDTKRFIRDILITYKNVILNNTIRHIKQNRLKSSGRLVRKEIRVRYPNLISDINMSLKGQKYMLWKEYYEYIMSRYFNGIISLFLILRDSISRRQKYKL